MGLCTDGRRIRDVLPICWLSLSCCSDSGTGMGPEPEQKKDILQNLLYGPVAMGIQNPRSSFTANEMVILKVVSAIRITRFWSGRGG